MGCEAVGCGCEIQSGAEIGAGECQVPHPGLQGQVRSAHCAGLRCWWPSHPGAKWAGNEKWKELGESLLKQYHQSDGLNRADSMSHPLLQKHGQAAKIQETG